MREWGLNYEILGLDSNLVMVSITPFSQSRPYAEWAAAT
jgi:hypothetical protein